MCSAPNKFGSNLTKAQVVFVCNWPGAAGSTFINDTAAHTGTFSSITATAAAVATVINNGVTQTSVPIPAGVTIYGNFTSITLASGSVMANN